MRQLVIIHEKDRFKTYEKVKNDAGVAFRQPMKGIINNDEVVTLDDTQKVDILADPIQNSHQSEKIIDNS